MRLARAPAGAMRAGSLRAVEGTSAFGAGSLAVPRLAGGPGRAGVLLAGSLAAWVAAPLALAVRSLRRSDL